MTDKPVSQIPGPSFGAGSRPDPRAAAPRILVEPWGSRLAALERWLLYEATRLPDVGAVIEALSERLVEAGLPLARSTSHVRVLHSERVGVTRIWRRGRPLEEVFFPHGAQTEAVYQRSPLRVVYETHEWVELRTADETADRYGVTADLRAEGITHYVIAPAILSNGVENAVSWSTDRPEGFDETHLALLRALLPALTPALELRATHRILNEVLRIYVGSKAGSSILSGNVRRGDVRKIRSAILVCDMRRFSTLTADMDAEGAVALLNRYLDGVVPAVSEAGGEVLKFIGDGVLAVFADTDPKRSELPPLLCERAIDTAWTIRTDIARLNAERPEGVPEIRVRIALHYGEAAYGNIGAGDRLDFTVIGSDVNLASRVNDLGSQLDRELLFTEAFVAETDLELLDLGSFPLKGFAEPRRVFGLASEKG